MIFFAAMALVTLLAGCDPDDGADNRGNQLAPDKLVGSWLLGGAESIPPLVFGQNTWTKGGRSGTYTLDGDVLTMMVGDSVTGKMRVIMLYDYNVLVLRFQDPAMEDYGISEPFSFYYRENATVVAPQADIQGKWFWFWYINGESKWVRCALEFSGNTFDFIASPYQERGRGTYTYENGIVHFHVTEILRKALMDSEEPMDAFTPDNLYEDWTPLEPGSVYDPQIMYPEFEMPLVSNGDDLYTIVVGLPAYFEKQ